MDITSKDLGAAILDQKVAGQLGDKRYAYVPVSLDDDSGCWGLGIAVERERGYSPVNGLSFAMRDDAQRYADDMNAHLGLDRNAADNIIITTMWPRKAYNLAGKAK